MYDCSSVFLAGRILTALKFLFRGTCRPACSDQAANIFEVLAWSLHIKSNLRTDIVFDDSKSGLKLLTENE